MSVPWAKVAKQLNDGGNGAFLCDIVVPAAAAGDWQVVLELLRTHQVEWQVSYSEDGDPAELPQLTQRLFDRSLQASSLISMSIAGLPIRGHVFGGDWIEFDVPARDINGQDALDALAGFVAELGRALGKEVRATPEAAHDAPIFLYDPSLGGVHPSGPSQPGMPRTP